MSDEGRLLTEKDVEAIVTELKKQLVNDFQLEVGRGIVGWLKKAMWMLLFLLALYGIAGDRDFISQVAAVNRGQQ